MSRFPESQRVYLEGLADALSELLGDQLVGVYVHGSIALGGFHPKTSDIANEDVDSLGARAPPNNPFHRRSQRPYPRAQLEPWGGLRAPLHHDPFVHRLPERSFFSREERQ